MPNSSNLESLVGVAAAAGSLLIFNHFVPGVADQRQVKPFNGDLESAEREALFASTGFVLVTAGLMKSLRVFIIGGVAIIAVDFAMKHANAVDPSTGKMASSTEVAQSYPMPDYGA
jgi:hypothetical protein